MLRHAEYLEARGAVVSNVDCLRLLVRANDLILDVSDHLVGSLDLDPIHDVNDLRLRALEHSPPPSTIWRPAFKRASSTTSPTSSPPGSPRPSLDSGTAS
uniref:Uncharacterized protein n=2 Tax=Aegilops tauschii TaxID=37682 RepID=A0A453L3R8_AEGTS